MFSELTHCFQTCKKSYLIHRYLFLLTFIFHGIVYELFGLWILGFDSIQYYQSNSQSFLIHCNNTRVFFDFFQCTRLILKYLSIFIKISNTVIGFLKFLSMFQKILGAVTSYIRCYGFSTKDAHNQFIFIDSFFQSKYLNVINYLYVINIYSVINTYC